MTLTSRSDHRSPSPRARALRRVLIFQERWYRFDLVRGYLLGPGVSRGRLLTCESAGEFARSGERVNRGPRGLEDAPPPKKRVGGIARLRGLAGVAVPKESASPALTDRAANPPVDVERDTRD